MNRNVTNNDEINKHHENCVIVTLSHLTLRIVNITKSSTALKVCGLFSIPYPFFFFQLMFKTWSSLTFMKTWSKVTIIVVRIITPNSTILVSFTIREPCLLSSFDVIDCRPIMKSLYISSNRSSSINYLSQRSSIRWDLRYIFSYLFPQRIARKVRWCMQELYSLHEKRVSFSFALICFLTDFNVD